MKIFQLKESLKKVVSDYLDKNPHCSLRSMAEQAGCGRYFLNKIVSEEMPSTLDANKVLLLTKFLSGKNSLREIADSFDEHIKEELTKIFQVDFSQSKVYGSRVGNEDVDLYDYDEYLLLVLCTLSCGTTKNVIEKILGENGLSLLNGLLEAEIVTEKNSRYFLADGTDFFTSLKIFKHHIPTYARFYHPARAGQERNYLHVETQGLNNKGLKLAQALHQEFHEKLVQLKKNQEFRGHIPWFSVAFMDTFTENLTETLTETLTKGEIL